MSEDRIVTIGGRQVRLTPHPSYTVRWEIATAAADLRHGLLPRLMAAALGACWTGAWPGESPSSQRPTYEGSGLDPLTFGAAVIDSLISGGAAMPEVAYAGTVAFSLIAGGLFGEREVKQAEDFFDPSVAGQTG
jgi:hypothetical protein